MKTTLDDVDVKILQILQKDGRITNADLAKAVALSPPSVLARVRLLEGAGLIRRYVAILDPDRMGFKITAWVMITLALHQDQPIERFRKAVGDIPEVLECYHVSGDFDFLLKVAVRDMKEYERFVREKLSRINSVGTIRSSFVYATPKHTTELPF